MSLIGNYSVLNKSPCKWLAGNATALSSGVGVGQHARTRAATNRNNDWCKFSLQERSTPATILRFAQGDLLRHVTPEDQQCDTLGGWPLAWVGKTLCTAPMLPAEAAAMPAWRVTFVPSAALLARGDTVLGIDNLNAYYDPTLKEARLKILLEKKGFSFTKGDKTCPITLQAPPPKASMPCPLI